MIPAIQREALDVLAEVCDLSPDVRLGQLFAHLGFLGDDQTGRSLWDIDDEQLLAVFTTTEPSWQHANQARRTSCCSRPAHKSSQRSAITHQLTLTADC